MTGKDVAKLGSAVAIIGIALGLYIVRTRSVDAEGQDSVDHFYCTKTQKFFEIKGEEHERKIRQARRAVDAGAGGDGEVRVAPKRGGTVTQALSPYTNEWTGIPAVKCKDCGEVFALDTDAKKQSICPKCQWNPMTDKKGISEGAKDALEGKGEKKDEESP